MKKFKDRQEAGIALAKQLLAYSQQPETLVLALPRGGVPVAYEIAQSLSLPLDVFIVRKLGVPAYKELALGAIASGDRVIFNDEIIHSIGLSDSQIQSVIRAEKKELGRREKLYRKDRPPLLLKNKTVILVDDGIATGATMLAACKAIVEQKPAQIIVAVPVVAYTTWEELKRQVDDFVCLLKPENFYAVGFWYDDFTQISDEEVSELLDSST